MTKTDHIKIPLEALSLNTAQTSPHELSQYT